MPGKIYTAIQELKGPEVEIPNVGRNDLPEFFKDMGYKVGVEIGTATGDYAEILSKDGLKLYTVDPYQDYSDYHVPNIQKRLDSEILKAQERLKPYDCTMIRKTSVEAAQDFEDNSLDFVYIDGHHGIKFVMEDLYEWSKKVRKGGCISGHDFVRTQIKTGPYVCHVKQATRAFADAYRIKDWYILGRKHFPKGTNEVRDKWRSWFWIKDYEL